MEKKMKYTLMPTLKSRALTQMAVALCNQDIRCALTSNYFVTREEEWKVLKITVREKTSHLLKGSLQKELLNVIRTIYKEMSNWREYHETYLIERAFLMKNLNKLCWTYQGTVDKKKTAEVFIKDKSLDVTKRYKLACANCLENDIPVLWDKISENRRSDFYNEYDLRRVSQRGLIVFWTYVIKGEVAKMKRLIEHKSATGNPYHYALECAAWDGNIVAFKYFFQKLIPEERESSLIGLAKVVIEGRFYAYAVTTCTPKQDFTDVLCFLLSQMTEAQQAKMFEKYPYQVLRCFLDWPWQDLFIELSVCVCPFLPEKDYDKLLNEIVCKVLEGNRDCNYQKLFSEFWQRSSIALKQYVIRRWPEGRLMLYLFTIKDRENISLILKDTTLEDKEKLLFGREGKDICDSLTRDDKWDLLTYFMKEVSECFSSEDNVKKFREEFMVFIEYWQIEEYLTEVNTERVEFYNLLNKILTQGKNEFEWNSPVKRLRV